ncbi:DNA methyltransferase [Mycoplasmopsis californica HAZ160_1]|uniref:DNA methyltransferase n=1 Tax=Mycoplasmopsis californica HAZ160_1 TaxID=1397850 RepID=A0AAT9F7Y6_9BACT|nr:site-specific DNA-methyltransferase [Mycoplasmopsis californica]BAP01019.1 DNA methyltransferase [Mycoplasmopsis californica HAZ160_1]BBG42654.1 DNA methyltransferase [Mycoplasmopsis californica]BBG43229.1 DNA methyltransferase [Mycoplasmopsis californica]
MANLSKIKREKMLEYLNKLKQINSDDENMRAITEIENALSEKKYGLVWEEHSEKVDEMLEHNIPIFVEDGKKKIVIDKVEGERERERERFNFLLEGDNLHSLKLLTKTHKGRIDVIYIDPPYNTGNKDFIYDDCFIDKTDGYSHSKWLSFMQKRLVIARELLSDEGVIFISIDEHEFAQLKLLCDDVFGELNFVENFIWIKNSTKNLSKTTSTNHEYIITYAKNIELIKNLQLFRKRKEGYDEVLKLVEKFKNEGLTTEQAEENLQLFFKKPENFYYKAISTYKYIDENWNVFTSSDASAPKSTGIGNIYNVLHPITGKVCKLPKCGWRYTEETMKEHIKNGLIYFGKDETTVPRFKRLLTTVETEVRKSVIIEFSEGKKELQKIFGEAPFDNAKPIALIKDLFLVSQKNSIILDFFAGSGTTGHAVTQLNKEDGGNRKYILCTNNENNICEQVTYQRLKHIQTDLPHNLKYFKTDFISKYESEEDEKTISEKMLDHIKELIELEHHIEIDNKKYIILYNEEKLDTVLRDIQQDGKIFIPSGIFLSRTQQSIIKEKNISVIDIPEYYFRNELREVGELW